MGYNLKVSKITNTNNIIITRDNKNKKENKEKEEKKKEDKKEKEISEQSANPDLGSNFDFRV